MAVLYVVAAWLVMQVAGVLMDLGVLPQNLGPWVMAVLAIGFPIALVVSWFFDITPEGVVRDADVAEGHPALAFSGRRSDFVIIAMLAAAVILLLVWEPPSSDDEALTVLPFESMTGVEEASFSEGVSIELLNLMAQLRRFKIKNPPESAILARFPDVTTFAREMDVRWVLKGRVRRAEQRVRVAVQLIDADNDELIVWSNVFDRELSAENLFAIQTEIARSITSELRQTLDEPAEQRLSTPPTQNTEAYNAYLVGRQRLTDLRVSWSEDAVEHFAKAIELDPKFGNAYSGLADACLYHKGLSNGYQHQKCPEEEDGLVARARDAVRLAPDSGEAWISLGKMIDMYLSSIDRESDEFTDLHREADEAYQHGLALNPGYSRGYLWYGEHLAYARPGHFETFADRIEAFGNGAWDEIWEKGLDVDPLSVVLHIRLSQWGMPEESLWHAQRMVEIAPDSPLGYERMAAVLWVEHGHVDQSLKWTAKAAKLDPKRSLHPWHSGYAYLALGDVDMALAYFELAQQLRPVDQQTSFQRAFTLLLAGHTEEAVGIFETLLTEGSDAEVSWSLKVLAGLDVHAGHTEAALTRYRQYQPECFDELLPLDFDRECPDSHFLRVLQEAGEAERAEQVAAVLAELFDWFKQTMARIGKGYEGGGLDEVGHYATIGRHEDALSTLERYVNRGRRGYRGIRANWRYFAYYDITVDSIRDHPRFRAAIAVIEADIAQQLENVRAMERAGELPTLEELRAKLRTD